jgi:hypothetical protein
MRKKQLGPATRASADDRDRTGWQTCAEQLAAVCFDQIQS